MKTPTPKQKDARLRLPQNSALVTPSETVEEASITAAYRIAEAENKSFLAAEAVKEAERVSKMAEDTDAMLQLVKEIYEQCNFVYTYLLLSVLLFSNVTFIDSFSPSFCVSAAGSRGEIVLLA